MTEVGGYEIMPYKEIVVLKKQIEELQRKTGDTDSKQLLISMANLTKSMDNMLQLFKTAAEEMKLEQKEEEAIAKKVGPLLDTVNELKGQNKIIAEGMVAIADMVKEMKDEKPPKPSSDMPLGPEPFKPEEHKEHIMPPPIEPVRFVPSNKPKGPGALPPLGGMPPPGHHEPFPPLGEPIPPPGGPHGPGPLPPSGGPPEAGPLPPLDEPFPPLGKPKKKSFLGLFKKKK